MQVDFDDLDSEDESLPDGVQKFYSMRSKGYMYRVISFTLFITGALCFMLGIMVGDQSDGGYFSCPHLQIFIQWVKTHTIHRRAAEDLEMLGQATGLPIQVTSSTWPGIIPVVLWCIAGIKGAQRAFS